MVYIIYKKWGFHLRHTLHFHEFISILLWGILFLTKKHKSFDLIDKFYDNSRYIDDISILICLHMRNLSWKYTSQNF